MWFCFNEQKMNEFNSISNATPWNIERVSNFLLVILFIVWFAEKASS